MILRKQVGSYDSAFTQSNERQCEMLTLYAASWQWRFLFVY